MKTSYKVYITSKESDIDKRNTYYQHIIAHYGIPSVHTDVYCQGFRCDVHYKPGFLKFVIEKMEQICLKHPSATFYFYSQKLAHLVKNEAVNLGEHILFINDYDLIYNLDDKITSRIWIKEFANIIPFCLVGLNELDDLSKLHCLWPNTKKFVMQHTISCGGEGTYIFNSSDQIFNAANELSSNTFYIVSPYLEDSTTISCNLVVYESETIVLPPGKSCDSHNNTNDFYRPIYSGIDFSVLSTLPKCMLSEIYEISILLGRKLANMGYRGICGVDYIIQNHNVYIIELNPRYLGSSFIIDKALLDNNLPPLAFFQEDAFINTRPISQHKEKLEHLSVNYKSHMFSYNELFRQQEFNNIVKNPPITWQILRDGLDYTIPLAQYEKDTYLFRAIEKL